MKSYLKGGGTMEYNPNFFKDGFNVLSSDRYTIRLVENSIWYAGIDYDLQLFYERNTSKMRNHGQISDALNYFWRNADRDIRKLHSGLPQLICEKMVDLIIGNGFYINLADELRESKDNDRLQDILKENKIHNLLQHGIETESWAGGVPIKITINPLVSELPIIEVIEPEHYSYRSVSGRIVEDIFTTFPEDGNNKYRLKEMYGVEEQGNTPISYIRYKLERVDDKSKEWVEVPLDTLPSTSNLNDINIVGYDKKFSMYKPNKTPNSEFRGSLFGESDFSGSIGAFDAIDEILSIWIQEARDTKTNRYIPSNLIPKNRHGDSVLSKITPKDHIIYEGSISESAKENIEYKSGPNNSDKHIESYKAWIMIALNNAGLSPLTIGVTGLEAQNAGEASQKEREKVSIRTRNKKISMWTEYLNDLLERTMIFDDIMRGELDSEEMMLTSKINEYPINTVFEDYVLKSKADRTTEVTEGYGAVWSTLRAVKYVHVDLTETEQLAESAMIKIENGKADTITTAEASALQALNIEQQEMLQDEGVEIIDVEQGQEDEDGLDIEENEVEQEEEQTEEE